ncbi:MAG: MFS transporter [Pseudomonadota bacterium]
MSSERVDTQFRWFLTGQGFWFAAFGLQSVMFPYLVVSVLQESPERVGIAQMCVMAPALLLMLPGGMLADAFDLRQLLVRLQCAAMVPALTVAAVASGGGLTFGVVIAFALAQGSLQALVMPTRDALLGRVAGDDVQRAVATAMLLQFLAQVAGFALAGSAGWVGVPTLLVIQACAYGVGAVCAAQMLPVPPLRPDDADATASGETSALRELGNAFVLVARSPSMGPVTLQMIGVGVSFIGVFSVVIPLMVRDLYAGGSVELAMVNLCFVLGVLVSTLVLRARPPVERQGRAIFLSGCGGLAVLLCLSAWPPMVLFYLLILIFGIGAGVAMSLGRTLIQQAASAAHRARILAIYSLAFLGAAPIGSFTMGVLAEHAGLDLAIWAATGAMAALMLGLRLRSGIWQIRANTPG